MMTTFLTLLISALGIIPAPKSVTEQDGSFVVPEKIEYIVTAAKKVETAAFEGYLSSRTEGFCPASSGLNFEKAPAKAKKADVRFLIGPKYYKGGRFASEGYALTISPSGITVSAASPAGAFYAVQSLMQMACNSRLEQGRALLPCCTISDEPSYGHRGLMFDVSRHFRTVSFIKKQMDAMALLKMNRFHFHLEDAVGWRLQLDCYPELTRKCAFRRDLEYKSPCSLVDEPAGYVPGTIWDEPGCYGGYYTKDQIREIIAYAAERNITVIPEVELPGHSAELFECHREIFCSGENVKRTSSVCPGKEETFTFFQTVLSEVMELFPSEYVHIGGDEASKRYWKTCPDCQKRMKDEGLGSVEELQSYMIRRIDKFVASKGHKIIGWDEIMQGGLSEGATVMSWRGPEHGLKAIGMGHDIIMSPTQFCYLDYYQNAPHLEPQAIGGYLPIRTTYSFVMPESPHMLGIQGNLWSEYITMDSHYEYMLYPRAYAIAELGWTPKERRNDYEEFRGRAVRLTDVFKDAGFTTFRLEDEVKTDPYRSKEAKICSIAEGCSYEITGVHPSQNENKIKGTLTNCRTTGVVWFDGRASVTIDLGALRDIHTVCPYFMRVGVNRESAFPSEVRVSVSADKAAFRQIGVMRSQIDDSNTPWGSLALPLFCNESGVRYVRIEFDPTTFCPAVQRVRVDRKKYDQPTGSMRFAVSGKKDGVLCTATAISEIAIN